MRERLLAGEELTNRGVQAEYGISNDHTVSDAATKLRHEGHNVVKERRVEKGPKGRAVVQTFWHVERKKKKSVPKPKKAPSKRSSPKGSISEQLRKRLIDGEALSAQQVAEEYGVSRSLLGVVIGQMRLDGFPIETKRIEGGQAQFSLSGSKTTAPAATSRPRARLKSRRAIYADLALRFEAGERIDAHMVMNDYGVDQIRYLAGFINTQRKKGWTFSKSSQQTEGGWRTVYRLKQADPKKAPAWVGEPPTEELAAVVVVGEQQLQSQQVGDQVFDLENLPPDLPPLATQVSVVLHLWDPETGVWTLGLRNGETSWLIPVAHKES